MAQAKALDALAPFLALSKTATSPRYTADLIVRATSHPNTFVFAELLQTVPVQALATADAEYAAYLTLLQIFSYGTYADYERYRDPSSSGLPQPTEAATTETTESTTAAAAAPPSVPPSSSSSPSTTSFFPNTAPLPPLNDDQARKLRQLSLISLATDRASLGYAHLVRALRLGGDADHDSQERGGDPANSARALETLVMSAVYAGLVTATLDPAHQGPPPRPTPRGITLVKTAGSNFSGGGGGGGGGRIHGLGHSAAALGKKPMTLNMFGGGGSASAAAQAKQQQQQRFNKRGSNLMTEDAHGASGTHGGGSNVAGGSGSGGAAAFDDDYEDEDEEDEEEDDADEAMDVDDDGGGAVANKRVSRRKL
ncbi:cop9 signalosome subunit 7 [Niveomyces insectorum RCEF 264]|uniref:Cop9 signalosome subunit 7 n=1 Tax=Niveomyces insectorum RCEF 264 TaxID=1081102 RepID=A0A168A3S4_9HYPO|nr:cop9 signalosome subunit 7 [Niveomyces insectorum RCEF 264]